MEPTKLFQLRDLSDKLWKSHPELGVDYFVKCAVVLGRLGWTADQAYKHLVKHYDELRV